jgi:hypothetical protein
MADRRGGLRLALFISGVIMKFMLKFKGQEGKRFGLKMLLHHINICFRMGMLSVGEEITIKRVE